MVPVTEKLIVSPSVALAMALRNVPGPAVADGCDGNGGGVELRVAYGQNGDHNQYAHSHQTISPVANRLRRGQPNPAQASERLVYINFPPASQETPWVQGVANLTRRCK
jgi:hypothetical protein